jgi:hypothetical protein
VEPEIKQKNQQTGGHNLTNQFKQWSQGHKIIANTNEEDYKECDKNEFDVAPALKIKPDEC